LIEDIETHLPVTKLGGGKSRQGYGYPLMFK